MLKKMCFKKFALLFFSALLMPALMYGQSYEEVYEQASEEVRSEMDFNKMNGKPILTNVYVNYEFSVSGLNENGNKERISEILSSNIEAINISLNPTNDHISFTCPVINELDKLKVPFAQNGLGLNNIYKKEYTILKH